MVSNTPGFKAGALRRSPSRESWACDFQVCSCHCCLVIEAQPPQRTHPVYQNLTRITNPTQNLPSSTRSAWLLRQEPAWLCSGMSPANTLLENLAHSGHQLHCASQYMACQPVTCNPPDSVLVTAAQRLGSTPLPPVTSGKPISCRVVGVCTDTTPKQVSHNCDHSGKRKLDKDTTLQLLT